MGNSLRKSVSVLCLILAWAVSGLPIAGAQTGGGTAVSPTTSETNAQASPGAPEKTGEGKPPDTGSSGKAPAGGGPASPVPVATPKILAIVPAAPLIAPNQPLTLTGSDFKDGLTVTFTDAGSNSYTAEVQSVKPDRLVVLMTLGVAGGWKVTATNKDGKSSDPLKFAVANSPALKFQSPKFIAFVICSAVATVLLLAIIAFVLVEIIKAQKSGWSLGEALSEESAYQPRVITQKSDVIIYASSSRVIALIGLMGILAIVVGVGYSIVWSLTIYGSVPDLSQVRSFLYGAACLFAPYIANQLGAAFTPSAKTQSADGQSAATITGVAPGTPQANTVAQPFHVTGPSFQAGTSLYFTDPNNGSQTVAASDIASVAPTLISANIILDTPGSWKVAVVNPPAAPSAPFSFTVKGSPTVNAVEPASPTQNPAAQPITFSGMGFVSGLKVVLTKPDGTTIINPTPQPPTSQQVTVSAILDVAGSWKVVITNPDGDSSKPLTFTVN